MGMYPGATLCYGIDIDLPSGVYWEDFSWAENCDGDYEYAIEQELERLGIEGVSLAYYGNMGYGGETGTILCAKSYRFYAYDPTELSVSDLTIESEDTERLGQAWAALFPGVEVTAPKWLMSLSFG